VLVRKLFGSTGIQTAEEYTDYSSRGAITNQSAIVPRPPSRLWRGAGPPHTPSLVPSLQSWLRPIYSVVIYTRPAGYV